METSFKVLFLASSLFFLLSCKNVSKVEYDPRFTVINENASPKIEDWIAEDSIAYGLVIYYDEFNVPQLGKPVKCKVESVSKRGVKCVSLEKVSLFDKFKCNKIGIELGETWYDVPQDMFRTREDAMAFLNLKGIDKLK